MMIKRPSDVENATLDWKAFVDKSEDGATKSSIEEVQVVSNCLPFFHSNDGAKPRSCVLEGKCATSKEIPAEGGSTVIKKKQNDTEQPRAALNIELHASTDGCQSEVDKMDFSGSASCCKHHDDAFRNQHLRVKSSIHADSTMQPKPAEQTAKEAIETYCRTWKELERCRDKVTKLSQENTALNERLKEYRWDRERHRNQMQAEKQFRERIQNDLRKIVKDMECHRPEELPAPYEASSFAEEAEIGYFKDQLKIYQEDFKQEKDEKLKLRELNSLLTRELEEAKHTIESQNKKLLVYAQIFSNGTGAQVVIPPAYIGRRVRSNPTSPSYNQLHTQGRNTRMFSEMQDIFDERPRNLVYDPIYDIVPKGCDKKGERAKQQVERRTSVP